MPGVISHATNIVEHPKLKARSPADWAAIVGRENVVGGADCGMGGRVHAEIGWAKLAALAEGAALASKTLWHLQGTIFVSAWRSNDGLPAAWI